MYYFVLMSIGFDKTVWLNPNWSDSHGGLGWSDELLRCGYFNSREEAEKAAKKNFQDSFGIDNGTYLIIEMTGETYKSFPFID